MKQRTDLSEKGFYTSFRMKKSTFFALQRDIISSYENSRALMSEERRRTIDSYVFNGVRHTFTDYLASTVCIRDVFIVITRYTS